MIHTVLGKLATDPGIFAEHASAYAELAMLEARAAALAWQHRALAWLASGLVGLLALAFSGLAVMLCAVIDWRSMPAPWVLVAVPAALWAGCAALGCRAQRQAQLPRFPHLRQQWALDTAHVLGQGKSG